MRLISLFFLIQILCTEIALASTPADWHAVTWFGEKAWESTSSGWTAIVSEEKARLVCIKEIGEHENLLYTQTDGIFSKGGHRCWLGPQTQWKISWPPPDDWENTHAAQIKISEDLLTLIHSNHDKNYPELSRTYQWEKGILHCTVKWQSDEYFVIQIFQIPPGSMVHIQRTIQSELPLGYALPPIHEHPMFHTDREIAAGMSKIEGDTITLWYGYLAEKIAVAPQVITAEIGNYQLKISRGQMTENTTVPERGLLTQVFMGDWMDPFIELEQLSPIGNGQPALSETLIEPVVKK